MIQPVLGETEASDGHITGKNSQRFRSNPKLQFDTSLGSEYL